MPKNFINRDGFSSRFGIIAAAAGSAVGLANIWRFPYINGQGGGAAFIIVYAVSIVFIGMEMKYAYDAFIKNYNSRSKDSFTNIDNLNSDSMSEQKLHFSYKYFSDSTSALPCLIDVIKTNSIFLKASNGMKFNNLQKEFSCYITYSTP